MSSHKVAKDYWCSVSGSEHYAHDLTQLKSWPAKPANVAFEKDFYRVDMPGVNTDEIEKVFWDLEGEAARVLKKIIQLNKIPGRPRDYEILMHFMAQLVMRRPSVRENQQQTHEKLLRMVAKMHASMPDDQLKALFRRMREQDAKMAEVDLDEFREFVKADEYTIEFSQNHHIKELLTALLPVAADTIAPLLAARHWVLCVAQDGAGHFITTDRPVFLTWTIEVPPFFENSPGFALENTLVLFPISKTLLIYGKFDGPRGAIIPAAADNGNTPSRQTCFPIFDSAAKYQAMDARKVQGMTQGAINAIDASKPYKGGNEALYTLHELEIADKHHALLTTLIAVHQATIDVPGTIRDFKSPLFALPKFREPLKDGDVFFVCEPGVEYDTRIDFDVGLCEPDIVKGRPIVQALGLMVDHVNATITRFEKFL
jgi:hypothetical protein